MVPTLGTSTTYQADVRRYLDRNVLRLAQRHLVLRQWAQKIRIPQNEGLTYTATRFNYLVLPYAPLNEGVPPVGQTPTISQVTGVVMQWGDRCNLTDIAEITPLHRVVEQATRLLRLQVPQTYERNLFNQIVSGTQVNYVGQVGARANLTAGDLLDPYTVNRTVSNLKTLGAPMMNGPTGENVNKDIEEGPRKATASPATHEHYVAVAHPIALNDFANNATVQLAWSYSDINKLYINEVGQWRGLHFCESNMVPYWVGIAAPTGTPGTSGNLATNANYLIIITGSDPNFQYEQQISQISAAISVTGPTGSISVTMPSTPANYTWSAYISVGAASVPQNLALSASGPTVGPYAGQAVQIPGGTTAVLTGIGLMQAPPAAPATGVPVFPTFVFGEDYFAALELSNLTWTRLLEADKSDPLNQIRVIGWKGWDGSVLLNQMFGGRIESSASNTGAFG
jgi:N4-gp56 family major capsid protein